MSKQMALRPRLSEKALAQSQDSRTYVFMVPAGANKHAVSRAVEQQFEVTVTDVNMMIQKGKAKRTISQKGRRALAGRMTNVKKAYVTLAEGQKLPIFDAIEEEEAKQEATQEKLTKAMEKQAAKEEKQEKKTTKAGPKVEESQSEEPEKPKRRGFHLRGRKGGDE